MLADRKAHWSGKTVSFSKEESRALVKLDGKSLAVGDIHLFFLKAREKIGLPERKGGESKRRLRWGAKGAIRGDRDSDEGSGGKRY